VASFKSGMALIVLIVAGGIVAGYKLEQVYRRQATGDRRQAAAVSGQRSATSPQPLAAGHQLSAVGDQSSAAGSPPAAGTGAIRSQPKADG
jgi:hypothetical protein